MQEHARPWSLERVLVVGAIVIGVAIGSYGIASAASGSGSSSGSSSGSLPSGSFAAAPTQQQQQPWGRQRSDETPLTGNALAKVTQLAKAKVPGGTIVRVETDADGNSAYEAHMVKADGSPVTVYVNKQFEVVSVESGMPGPPGGQAPSSSSGASA
jgi:hypothetical protein